MATYAIGDIHGCWQTLQSLLNHIDFDADTDRLWLVGDLVNGGPDSLAVLRWARRLDERATVVLGNHDLHMLAVWSGAQSLSDGDTFGDVLAADDADELMDWLRRRPIVHRDGDLLMVHAGLLPEWSADDAQRLAAELEATLRAPDYADFFAEMYGDRPRRWDEGLQGADRLRVIVNAMTRMRAVTEDGAIDLDFKRTLDEMPAGKMAWFDHPQRTSRGTTVVFGHWSALGYLHRDNVYALDSGARWGGELTALRLEDHEVFQVESEQPTVFG